MSEDCTIPRPPRPVTRQRLEILESEQTYCQSLGTCIDQFMSPLAKILKVSTLLRMFGNIRAVHTLSSQLIGSLEALKAAADKEEIRSSSEPMDVETVMLRFAPRIRQAYSEYVINFVQSTSEISEVKRQNREVVQFLVDTSERVGPLESFLIMPVQRVCRYRLLLESLKHSEVDTPCESLDLALVDYSELADEVNQCVHRRERFEQLVELNERLQIVDARIPDFRLVHPHRYLIMEGILAKACRRQDKIFTFYLFNDLLMYANSNSTVHNVLSLDEVEIVDLPTAVDPTSMMTMLLANGATGAAAHSPPNGQPSRSVSPFGLDDRPDRGPGWLVKSPWKSFAVFAAEESEKGRWLTAIRKQLGECGAARRNIDTAAVWAQDSQHSSCQICTAEFTLFTRRHHCRKCGSVVCASCSPFTELMPNVHPTRPVKVCGRCHKDSTTEPPRNSWRLSMGRRSPLASSSGDLDMNNHEYIDQENGHLGTGSSSAMEAMKRLSRSASLRVRKACGGSDPADREPTPIDMNRLSPSARARGAKLVKTFARNPQTGKLTFSMPLVQVDSAFFASIPSSSPAQNALFLSKEKVNNCQVCSAEFTVLRGKYRCKNCNGVVCATCSPRKRILKHRDPARLLRVCTPCYNASFTSENYADLPFDCTPPTSPKANHEHSFDSHYTSSSPYGSDSPKCPRLDSIASMVHYDSPAEMRPSRSCTSLPEEDSEKLHGDEISGRPTCISR